MTGEDDRVELGDPVGVGGAEIIIENREEIRLAKLGVEDPTVIVCKELADLNDPVEVSLGVGLTGLNGSGPIGDLEEILIKTLFYLTYNIIILLNK